MVFQSGVLWKKKTDPTKISLLMTRRSPTAPNESQRHLPLPRGQQQLSGRRSPLRPVTNDCASTMRRALRTPGGLSEAVILEERVSCDE